MGSAAPGLRTDNRYALLAEDLEAHIREHLRPAVEGNHQAILSEIAIGFRKCRPQPFCVLAPVADQIRRISEDEINTPAA